MALQTLPSRRDDAILLAVIGACVGLAGLVGGRVRPAVESGPVALTQKQRERVEQAAQASIFGQFRTSMSDFLWLKVDKYVHDGVDLRAVTDEERLSGRFGKVGSDEGHEQGVQGHDGSETTQVLARQYDWRGPVGDIEREIQPYADMAHHKHREPEEALPLFRLMTVTNPKFVNGYTAGAYVIAREPQRLPEAIAFLDEGIRNNPESIECYTEMGALLARRQHRFQASFPYLLKALSLAAARDPQTLTEDEKEAWQDAYRCLVIGHRELKEWAETRRWAREGLRRFEHDPTCTQALKDLDKDHL